jgi:hypothetical protein
MTMTRIASKSSMALFAAAMLLTAVFAPAGDALALDRGGYSMEILIGGQPVYEYAARGRSYVEALKSREYSVRLCNRTSGRIAVALSVDGLNSIDARTTSSKDARKWVLGPYETIVVDGWQVSSEMARRFFFTTEEKSYGNWLGKTQNLGIVAAAVFREKQPPVSIYQAPMLQRDESPSRDRESDQAAPAEPSAPMGRRDGPAMSGPMTEKKSDGLAATGIGQQTSHPVQQVYFDSEDSPSAVLELRYEYRDSLIRLGVLPAYEPCPDELSRRERAQGFENAGFAPDPFCRRVR